MTTPLRVLIAGGGTGGHLYPGLAVARELALRRPDAAISFVGTAGGIEARVVPKEGFLLDLIRSAGLKGKSVGKRMRGIALLPLSAVDAWRVISKRRPHLVIGLGGYSSGPVVLLAAMRRIPTMILEQNAVPGFTNRWLARVIDAAAVTYETTLQFFPGAGFVTGNPVRRGFFRADAEQSRSDQPLQAGGMDRPVVRVLVVGGSQGARAINAAMIDVAPVLVAADIAMTVTHQTGERDVDLVRRAYERIRWEVRVEPFLYEMEEEMTRASLVVCRAGASTLAEVAAAGVPSILIPLPTATDDHQRKNAQAFAECGAAVVLAEQDLTADLLATTILDLARDPRRRAAMGQAARRLARPDAATRIVDRALALVAT